ncbi:elongation factor Ts [Candidatus Falkowbacteria bacterium HGW-Falkowbacteria-1]|jgi:elongation factor Ts|uniref:Elongation factor Ts n=1 Tax=Candidatus Falkowbacteria bacterium HGW-Falkowbacteria-1 TaxID=2013768 RepID=A0A2N2E9R9_9BACT|nr:MAG: elongation factor Ts [Candidatus Falkowbacteria bacterium HGW-Falkowbacteria-1]
MEQIKELRERTGAGMVDCKKALDESGGNIEKAIEILRKKGIAKAAKRSEREAGEGIIIVSTNDDKTEAYALELNSETDFVARNEKFQELAGKILEIIKNKKPESGGDLLKAELDGSTVEESISNLSGVIGEKLALGRFFFVSGQTVAAYSHLGGKIGVLVALDQADKNELATDIAMHIAAANPRYLNSEEVPSEELDKEKEIYKEQLLKEGKPENIIENIMQGKVKKYYSDVCLLDQEYIKDDKKSVKDILGGVSILKFVRLSL